MKKKLKNNFEEFLMNFKVAITKPEMAILPGHLAFFFVLALVPTITLISYGAAFLNLSTDVIFDFLTNIFSKDIANLLLNTTSIHEAGMALIITSFIGYFMASNGAASIILTSNAIYGVKNQSFFKRRIKAIVMTFFLILLFIFMLVVPVFGNKIIELFEYANIGAATVAHIHYVINLLQGPITWLIIYFILKVIYTMAPNKMVKSKSAGYGAIFTSIGWIIATYIYSFYINHLANYTAFYGGLANIVILMLWFYLLAYIFTIGIALNYRKEITELEKTGTLKVKN